MDKDTAFKGNALEILYKYNKIRLQVPRSNKARHKPHMKNWLLKDQQWLLTMSDCFPLAIGSVRTKSLENQFQEPSLSLACMSLRCQTF
ncbi:hypothetical protein NQ315_010426 [Exocentrus adspersus]|uniref:Integrase catalytic domain-containing protein n=1 Tax=Exocentrus adspersus TaxID=1586481 RepID=A0AAV8WB95_9CUCU|nr:hypothetical protein NQ315_010426 [Exocentrus adspersus]